MTRRFFLILTVIFSFSYYLIAQEKIPAENVPVITEQSAYSIPELNSRDILFKQYVMDVQQYYLDLAADKPVNVFFYSYKVKKDDTLFAIAARCNIPYDTIASLNSITAANDLKEGKVLILPSGKGLFVLDTGIVKKERPKNDIEGFLQNCTENTKEFSGIYNINGRIFIHYADRYFDQTTRSFFLDTKMRMPLTSYWISSDYGQRTNPLGKNQQFHRGIDLAAPVGTRVYACKNGTVTAAVKNDKVFGNYIVIKHPQGLSSIYAHLSKIQVESGQKVSTGEQIGLVGQTGQVTGPHLHFEIRLNGQHTDPNIYLKL